MLSTFLFLLSSCVSADDAIRIGVVDAARIQMIIKKQFPEQENWIETANLKIAEFSKAQKLNFVFDRENLKCFSKKHDITDFIFNKDGLSQGEFSAKVTIVGRKDDKCTSGGNSIVLKEAVYFSSTGVATKTSEIAFVNVANLLRDAQVSKNATKKLEEEFRSKDLELVQLTEELKSLKETDSDYKKLSKKLSFEKEQFKKSLNSKRDLYLKNVLEELNKTVAQYASTNQVHLLIQECVFCDPNLEVTSGVVSLADEIVK